MTYFLVAFSRAFLKGGAYIRLHNVCPFSNIRFLDAYFHTSGFTYFHIFMYHISPFLHIFIHQVSHNFRFSSTIFRHFCTFSYIRFHKGYQFSFIRFVLCTIYLISNHITLLEIVNFNNNCKNQFS